MMGHRILARSATILILAAALLAGIGCGGGSDTTTTSGPTAVFTPDTASPGAGTIALLSGTGNGAAITVRVTVTGVNSFFGTAFRIQYDPLALLFTGMTTTGSFLRDNVTDADVLFSEDHASVPGEVVITATRLNPTTALPVDVTATSDLLVLSFTARKVIVAASTEGRLDFGDPKQVCDGTVSGSGCGPIAVTWSGGGVSAQ